MKELLDNYFKASADFTFKRKQLEDKIIKTEEKLKKLKDRENKIWNKKPSWVNVVKTLANTLKKEYNFEYVDTSGPFGLACRITIDLSDFAPISDIIKEKAFQHLYSITLQPIFNDNELSFVYETGEIKPNYQPVSIGDLNGFNMVTEPLPTDIKEIYDIITKIHDKKNKELCQKQN